MSLVAIRNALENALKAVDPAMATGWENAEFTPPNIETPYQLVYLMPAEPDNREFGPIFQERGIFQVSLFYPLKAGTALAVGRAELLRSTFHRAASFVDSGVTVTITKTPEISQGSPDGDRWFIPVKCRFSAFVT